MGGMITDAKRAVKTCDHCSREYQPGGNRQHYCFDCLGPAEEYLGGVF